jgi:hypothetical protein
MASLATLTYFVAGYRSAVADLPPSNLPELKARASFVRGQIVIENLNDYDWTQCTLAINTEDPHGWIFDSVSTHIAIAARGVKSFPPNAFRVLDGSAGFRNWDPRRWPPISKHPGNRVLFNLT